MNVPTLHDFLRELDESRTYYRLTSVRDGAVMVEVALTDERWEIEFFDDREPEIEIYRSDGKIFGPQRLEQLRKMINE